ncbi:hypothetical protein B0O99DRAFT_698883 [Bisporella sp. PMI_857]|nr:hypothetical protein B0O99DRAFT_698883 [Bisporella sp. PMI_857]
MDYSGIPSYTRHWRTLYQHRQQWYQSILGAIMNYHFGILLPHFLFAWFVTALVLGPSPMRPLFLHLLAILLSLAARLIWIFLFRHPGQFAGLKRPGLAYRWTVLAVCGATTVPNLCVHAVVLGRSFRGLGEEEASLMAAKLEVVTGVLQTGLLGGASMVCVWMVWRFLVDWEDEMYDPCVKSELEGRFRRVAGEFEPGREPYSDTPHSSVSRRQGTAAINYFAVAYAKQRIEASTAAQEPERSHQRDIPRDSIIDQEQGEGAVENQDITISVGDRSPTPLRCITVARYDYMDKNHTGAHSWLSYPLIPAFIFTYSSILSIPMIMFINETRHSETPSL